MTTKTHNTFYSSSSMFVVSWNTTVYINHLTVSTRNILWTLKRKYLSRDFLSILVLFIPCIEITLLFFNHNFQIQYTSRYSFLIPSNCFGDHPPSSAIVEVKKSIFVTVQLQNLLWVRHVNDMRVVWPCIFLMK